MKHFVGIVAGGGRLWGVRFPDLDGWVGIGATPEAAVAEATEALRDVAAHKRGGGFALPEPRTLAEIRASGEIGPGETGLIVRLFS